ncbi:MAG: flagellar export protein FliJ [Vicinamibacterales bacterium]
MRPFRFRPAALLELRRKEESTARDVLARAQDVQARADQAVVRASDAVMDAARTLGRVQAEGATADTLAWHRSWIGRLRHDVDQRRLAAAKAATIVEGASVVVRDAVQRRRVLERLRDRAWRRYRLEADREHARDMDRVAGARYHAQRADAGGPDRGDDLERDPDPDAGLGR